MTKHFLSRTAALLLSLVPGLATVWLILHYFNTDLMAFFPAYDVDQYMYAAEARTFAEAGFGGGYYGSGGATARFLRFGPHGAAYPLLYGGAAWLLGGWRDWLAPFFNLVCVTTSLAYVATAMSLGRFACLIAFVCLFPLTMQYMPLSYQEGLQFAVALALAAQAAAYFGRLEAGTCRKRDVAKMLCVTFLATFTRPTWAVLFPALCFARREKGVLSAVYSLALGGVLLVAGYGFFTLFASPWHITSGPSLVQGFLRLDFSPLTRLAGANLASLLNFRDNALHTLELLLIMGGSGLMILLACCKRDGARSLGLAVFHACNVFAPLVVYVTAYNGTGYQLTRLVSAHFLLSFALHLLTAPPGAAKLVVAPVLSVCLGLFPMSLKKFVLFTQPAYVDSAGYRERVETLRREIAPHLLLTEKVGAPWLRTLAVGVPDAPVTSLAAPPFYGIQVYDDNALSTVMPVGFALLDKAAHDKASRFNALTPIVETAYGVLYRNDAAFGSGAKRGQP